MKKFFGLVLALVMALSLTTVAWGAATTVTTAAELATALANNEDVTLANDIVLTGEWTPIGNEDTDDFYTGTLDGQGHTISGLLVTSGDYAALIRAAKGATIKNLTVSGSVTADNAAGVVARVEGATVIENVVSNVTVVGNTKAGGISCNVCNTGSVAAQFNNCVNNGSVSGSGSNGFGGMIGYVNNDGFVEVANCVNTGAITGADTATQEAGAVIGWAAGTSKGTIIDYTNTGAITGHFWDIDGRVLTQNSVYLVGYCATPANWTVAMAKIGNSLYESMADALSAAGAGDTIVLLDDIAGEVVVGQPVTIDPNGYAVTVKAATGYTMTQNTAGAYVFTATSALGEKFDLYLANNQLDANLKIGAASVTDVILTEVPAKTFTNGSGIAAHLKGNNGEYYVKTTTPYTTSYAVTDANKTTVLYYVNAAGNDAGAFTYTAKATEFTKFSLNVDKCGYVKVSQMPAPTDFYFQLADGSVYKAAAASATEANNYLVGDTVYSKGAPQTVVDHTFTVSNAKYDTVTGASIPTQATCSTCFMPTTAIYANNKIPAGKSAYPIAGTNYSVVLNATPVGGAVVTPSTDKVQSAETFDAGIAMYVGMSVLAATGSAVVIGKKKD